VVSRPLVKYNYTHGTHTRIHTIVREHDLLINKNHKFLENEEILTRWSVSLISQSQWQSQILFQDCVRRRCDSIDIEQTQRKIPITIVTAGWREKRRAHLVNLVGVKRLRERKSIMKSFFIACSQVAELIRMIRTFRFGAWPVFGDESARERTSERASERATRHSPVG